LLKNDQLADLKIEKRTQPTFVGSIFKGKVSRVLPGMQAAFIDVGIEKAAFLHVGDLTLDPEKSKYWGEDFDSSEEEFVNEQSNIEHATPKVRIEDLIKEGQELLVQVSKDPIGAKGARVTTHVSLPGRLLVYTPTINHVGVSRRIGTETERERLKTVVSKLLPEGGIIVRTACEGSREEEISQDLDYLTRLWKEIQKSYSKKRNTGVVYSDVSVELRALRDLLSDDVSRVLIDDAVVFKEMQSFVSQFIPKLKNRLEHYQEPKPIFEKYEVEFEIERALERKVWLKSGGYVVFDEAEALTVVDVNTGKFVGKKDLEDTIVKTNLEAVKEITYQLRIRGCGGIIIIDFIDMEKEIHRKMVMEQLQDELKGDPVKTTVLSMSSLGLVEMTRKRVRPSLVSSLCQPCPYCERSGFVKRKSSVAADIFRALENQVVSPSTQPIVIRCHAEVADWVYEGEAAALEFLENKLNRPLAFTVDPRYHIEQFTIDSPVS
jgi:ribonuclease G